jgi:hypothetical protein
MKLSAFWATTGRNPARGTVHASSSPSSCRPRICRNVGGSDRPWPWSVGRSVCRSVPEIRLRRINVSACDSGYMPLDSVGWSVSRLGGNDRDDDKVGGGRASIVRVVPSTTSTPRHDCDNDAQDEWHRRLPVVPISSQDNRRRAICDRARSTCGGGGTRARCPGTTS